MEEIEILLKKLLKQQETVSKRLDNMEKQLKDVLHNQYVIYSRLLVTRKNMMELYSGEYPSLTENEEKELSEGRHPPLICGQKRKKMAH